MGRDDRVHLAPGRRATWQSLIGVGGPRHRPGVRHRCQSHQHLRVCPPLSGTVTRGVVPSVKVTVPLGVPVGVGVTVAVRVTGWPNSGAGGFARTPDRRRGDRPVPCGADPGTHPALDSPTSQEHGLDEQDSEPARCDVGQFLDREEPRHMPRLVEPTPAGAASGTGYLWCRVPGTDVEVRALTDRPLALLCRRRT
jgi:hypothetical protein